MEIIIQMESIKVSFRAEISDGQNVGNPGNRHFSVKFEIIDENSKIITFSS